MSRTASQIIAIRNPSASSHTYLSELIEEAEGTLREGAFGTQYPTAVALLVMHWIEMENRTGTAGAISSEREGNLARSYAVSASSSDWDSTAWGKELNSMIRRKQPMFMNRTI